MATKFPFSIWNYNNVGEYTTAEVDTWAECGLTVTMSPAIIYGEMDPKELIPYLDAAEKNGIKLIAHIKGLEYTWVTELGLEKFEERFTEVYNAIKHPALYGFYVGDEPGSKQNFQDSWDSIAIQRRVAPELKPYLNLHTGMDATPPELLGGRTFREWLKQLAEETGFCTFSYGTYDQVWDERGIEQYFENIKALVEAADGAGIDVWNTQLSSAHYMFRIPNYYETNWQITTAAACGSRGIIWFRFYDRLAGPNYHGSPIDEYGFKTPLYYDMLRAHRRFNDHFGELIMSLRHQQTYMTLRPFGGYPVLHADSHPIIKRVYGTEMAVIGFFKAEDGTEYMALVNESMDKPGVFNIEYDEENYELHTVLFNGKQEGLYKRSTLSAHWDGEWLYPSQMVMYKIVKK